MKIRITKACEVEIMVGSDSEGEPIFDVQEVKVGEICEVEVVDFGLVGDKLLKDYPLFEFGNGSAGTFFSECFEIIEGQDEFDEAFEEATI